MSDHDILPHQSPFTRYENPTPEQAAADIRAHELTIQLLISSHDLAREAAFDAEQCIRSRIETLQSVVDRGAACDTIAKREGSYAEDTGREIARRAERARIREAHADAMYGPWPSNARPPRQTP